MFMVSEDTVHQEGKGMAPQQGECGACSHCSNAYSQSPTSVTHPKGLQDHQLGAKDLHNWAYVGPLPEQIEMSA